MNRLKIVALGLVGLPLAFGAVAQAETITIDSDTTIDADNSFPDTHLPYEVHVIDGDNHPTVVNMVPGGSIGCALEAYDSSTVNVSGGSIGAWLYSLDSSTVNVSGGRIGLELMAAGSSTVNISGGSMSHLECLDSSTVNVTGGSIGGVYAFRCSTVTVNISGGSIGGVYAFGSSTVNISGGSIRNGLRIRESGTVNVFGSDLNLTDGLLTGTLADGTPLAKHVDIFGDGQLVLHNNPEPSTLLLLSMGGISLLAYRWRRKRKTA